MGLRFLITALFALSLSVMVGPAWALHPPAEHAPPQEQSEETPPESPPHASEVEHPQEETDAQEGDGTSLAEHGHAGEDPCAEEDHHDAAAGTQASGHAHWGEDGASTPFERIMSRLGVFHAVAVHFPIALILAAALAQTFVLTGRFTTGAETVRFLVWTGALGGVAAGLLGWAHSGPMGQNEAGVMLSHRVIGSALILGLGGLVGSMEWSRRTSATIASITFNTTLFVGAGALLINAFLGGALAHGGLSHLFGAG